VARRERVLVFYGVTMTDLQVVAAILAIGGASIAMRLAGYVAADVLPGATVTARVVRLAPGNLSIAFVTIGCVQGGWPSFIGSAVALTGMVISKRQWAALILGFVASALVAAAGW
jgi:hypothetical protein